MTTRSAARRHEGAAQTMNLARTAAPIGPWDTHTLPQEHTMAASNEIAVYVSAPWQMEGIEERVEAVVAAAAERGTTLTIVKPWWRTGGASGLDAATGKPVVASASAATPAEKQAKLSKDAADMIKLLKARTGPRVVLVLADGTLKSTIFLQGVAVGASKPVVVLSESYAAWAGVDGAGGDGPQPAWIGNLAMTPAAATFVDSVAAGVMAVDAIVALGTPKPPKVKTPKPTAAKEGPKAKAKHAASKGAASKGAAAKGSAFKASKKAAAAAEGAKASKKKSGGGKAKAPRAVAEVDA
jgi:hypothetical protein